MLVQSGSDVRSIENGTWNGKIYDSGNFNRSSNIKSKLNGISLFQPGRDLSGAAIALFSANLHSPLTVTHKTTLQGVVYQLDIALQNVETQSKGLIFIYDMSSSKYSNFDYDLSQKILTLLKVSKLKFSSFFLLVWCFQSAQKLRFFFVKIWSEFRKESFGEVTRKSLIYFWMTGIHQFSKWFFFSF